MPPIVTQTSPSQIALAATYMMSGKLMIQSIDTAAVVTITVIITIAVMPVVVVHSVNE